AEENIDLIIYLDVDDEVRLQNRLFRDGTQRPEDPDPAASAAKTKANFESRQATQFVPYTLPNRDQADMVIQVHAERLQEPAPDQFFKYTYDVRLR
nr:hypothetical protein [Candidatus Woesebacteria bacterium]